MFDWFLFSVISKTIWEAIFDPKYGFDLNYNRHPIICWLVRKKVYGGRNHCI